MSVTSSPADVEAADLAVLPGVGSAASAMDGLRERGLDEALRSRVRDGGFTLGICLGLQLALDESEEDGGVAGLGLLPGRAVRLRAGRVPRIGWAAVEPDGEAFFSPALRRGGDARPDCALRRCRRGHEPRSCLSIQFHPEEESSAAGARLLERCLSRA